MGHQLVYYWVDKMAIERVATLVSNEDIELVALMVQKLIDVMAQGRAERKVVEMVERLVLWKVDNLVFAMVEKKVCKVVVN